MAQQKQTGFTIVELLIVIVVIGILAALVLNSFNAAQTKARNASRLTELSAWKKAFEAYKATYGNYPAAANGGYCLGRNFPGGNCRDYAIGGINTYAEADSVGLMTELSKVASVSDVEHIPEGVTVGPYAVYQTAEVMVIGVFRGYAGECPQGTSQTYTNGAGTLLCYYGLKK